MLLGVNIDHVATLRQARYAGMPAAHNAEPSVLEAARAASFLKKEGVAIVNTQCILPMPVITGSAAYPEDPLAVLSDHKVEKADALQIAVECGSQKALNLVLLGMLSKHLPFEEAAWHEAIGACVPAKTLTVNLAAFTRGRELVS